MEFQRNNLPEGLDDRWKSNIHQAIFGYPIDADQDSRIQALSDDEQDAEKVAAYEFLIEGHAELRKAALDTVNFYSTDEVRSILAGSGVQLERSDVVLLRSRGSVLAVPDHGRWLYPSFQFSEADVSPAIELLHEKMKPTADLNADPWIELFYWMAARPELDGRAMMDSLWAEEDDSKITKILNRLP